MPPEELLAPLAAVEPGRTIAARRAADPAAPSDVAFVVLDRGGDFGLAPLSDAVPTAIPRELPPSEPGPVASPSHGDRFAFGGESADDSTSAPTLRRPASSAPHATSASAPATDVPPYRFRHLIGRGGQGEIWAAVQASLAREVAVKIHLEDDREEFFKEAYTSGSLEHPNIVPVHDLGEIRDARGVLRPMLAMKLVGGQPWNKLIASDRAAPGYNLESFLAHHLPILLAVCNAVAYAHSKGIIHRDLKPAQVMLGTFGEIYLVDWGLAVALADAPQPVDALAPRPRFNTLATATNPCGTPAYMAPEQTDETNERLGFHTDIYLLGAMLHELVSGQPPHTAPSSRAALLRAIDNEIDPPPSDCPEDLRALMRRAMASEPATRLQTVGEFRRGIEEYLWGVGRQRESVEIATAAAAQFDALHEDDYERLAAIGQELGRAVELWPGNAAAVALRERVASRHAEAALRGHDLLLARSLAAQIHDEEARVGLLARVEAAEEDERRVARQRRQLMVASAALLLVVIVGGAFSWRRIRAERDHALEAERIADRERHNALIAKQEADVARDRALLARGDAEDLLGFMLGDLRERLVTIGRLEVMDAVAERAKGYYDARSGEPLPADAVARKGRIFRQLGELRLNQGRTEEALALGRDGVALLESADQSNLDVLSAIVECQSVIAVALGNRGMTEDSLAAHAAAIPALEKLVAARPDDIRWRLSLASAHNNLGTVYRTLGRLDEALAAHQQSLGQAVDLAALDPANGTSRLAVAQQHQAIGLILTAQGKLGEAHEANAKGLAITEEVAAMDPSNAEWQSQLGFAYRMMGQTLKAQGDLEGSLAATQRSEAIWRAAIAADPGNATSKYYLGIVRDDAAQLLTSMGRLDEAIAAAREHGALLAELSAADPTNAGWKRSRSISLNRLGNILESQGKLDEALAAFEENLAALIELTTTDPANADWQRDLAISHARVAGVYQSLGRMDAAWAANLKFREVLAAAVAKNPTNAAWQRDMVVAYCNGARLAREMGRAEDDAALVAQAESLVRSGALGDPESPEVGRSLARVLLEKGHERLRAGARDDAMAAFAEGIAALEPLVASGKSDSGTLDTLVRLLVLSGRPDEARQHIDVLRSRNYTPASFTVFLKEHGVAEASAAPTAP